ncbi:hypothetical protein ATANTOWER_004872 [Ataeniobius toweri]|uniref:Uncharacterized protein n=1 Tax=Ataeniobius toweri TaxID=208326 RepID=A0ABU7A4D2_9TELE|nr:hypothetical protein [Ataeniobius toweri]
MKSPSGAAGHFHNTVEMTRANLSPSHLVSLGIYSVVANRHTAEAPVPPHLSLSKPRGLLTRESLLRPAIKSP